ncbi:efflux RND transporter periplasmic adaptor subunit [Desulfonatronum thiosulfatophilum]|uniref:efflux RND transporter periplasmic adaptor subunit n=1 Tax=Desulfonatronum thiosulfatophilum TaxID=617002 RepID=UPI00137B8AD8|nr:efflux RND transporter periplasmic adaptor subunit [Desulfonatronum thiosulfatophilum]
MSLRQITLSPQAQKLAEVVLAPVRRLDAEVEVRLTGKVQADETRLAYITAWAPGRIDELSINFTGVAVQRGESTATLYSPELITAQAELIQAVNAARLQSERGMQQTRVLAERTEQAAREKLRRLGMSSRQIEQIIEHGIPQEHMVLHAPVSGIVTEMNARQGMYVDTGTRLFTIADLSVVWVVLQAFESDLPWIQVGQQVDFMVEALPGETFQGEVVFIDPVVEPRTRTVGVRLNVPNPDQRLKPEMYVTAVQRFQPDEVQEEAPLVIPVSAPLLTGRRAVVYVALPERPGVYMGREVVLGSRAGNHFIVLRGLEEGELVVARGAFKIDSAVQVNAQPSMMTPEPGAGAAHDHDHGPIPDPREIPDDAPTTVMAVPSEFARQLPILDQAIHGIHAALDTADLDRIRAAFQNFGRRLEDVDAASLRGTHAALVWNELAMLLGNDAYLGGEIRGLREAERVMHTLEEHHARLTAVFVSEEAPEAPPVSPPLPAHEEDPHAGHEH